MIRRRSGCWSTQRVGSDGTTIRDAVFDDRGHLAMGVLGLAPVMTGATIDFWMLPIIAGLLLAPVTATLTARRDLGDWLASNGIFTAEGEVVPASRADRLPHGAPAIMPLLAPSRALQE